MDYTYYRVGQVVYEVNFHLCKKSDSMTVMKFSQARSDFDSSNLCKNCENLWSYLNRESVFCWLFRYKSFSNMNFRSTCFIRMGIKG